MAKITSKHTNQQMVSYADFSGGLNTSNAEEMIAQTELSRAVNVEIDHGTGMLRTGAGTETLLTDEGRTFKAIGYDSIGETFLVCCTDGTVCEWANGALSEVGELTGGVFPAFAAWEDGLLVASGGKMQYFHGGALETIEESPAVCNGVFVKDGRIATYFSDELHFSGVGDEHGWESESGDDSTAKWLQVGYKDGGSIAGVTNLSSDILIFKDNGHAYHLSGQYPDWSLREISRDVGCKGFRACCSIANEAVVLSRSMVQSVTTTQTYGDMRADDISRKVAANIRNLPGSVHIKYLPTLNQIWFLTGSAKFLTLDVSGGGYFEREYNGHVADAVAVGDEVYLLKENCIQRLDADSAYDEGMEMRFNFKAKTFVSNNEHLVKRVRFDITPFSDYRFECRLRVGNVIVNGTLPKSAESLWHDWSWLYGNDRDLWGNDALPAYSNSDELWGNDALPAYSNSDELWGNDDPLYENDTELWSLNMYRTDRRCVERLRSIGIEGKGAGGQTLFNAINFEIVEV